MKKALIVIALLSITMGLLTYSGREQIIDPELTRTIQSTIPECQERDRVADSRVETRPGYYTREYLDRYSAAAEACFSKFTVEYFEYLDARGNWFERLFSENP